MSDASQSFLTKLKKALSKLFKGSKKPTTSFRGPQELQQSRQGGIATSPRPVVQPPKPLEAARDTSTTSPQPTRDESRLQPQASTQTHPSLASRAQDYGESADVSPTEPPTFRTDRPHSEAVSALEQDVVSDRIKKSETLDTADESATNADRPISGITSTEAQRAAEPAPAPAQSEQSVDEPTKHEKAESATHEDAAVLPPVQTDEEPQATPREVNGIHPEPEDVHVAEPKDAHDAEPEPESSRAPEPEPEATPASAPEPVDRIDPMTAPEVVNKFDDEKVPVINEPNSPVAPETNFRMSATSGPLEDFPAGGEFY